MAWCSWRTWPNAGSPERSPLVPLLGAIPVKLIRRQNHLGAARPLPLPDSLAVSVLRPDAGASLWYVARRLYGNFGGFIALALYTFSPIIMTRANQVQEDVVAAWGAFGLIFTAIAVAHTLYAPREVILWNWRRILLLGISIALCIGAQFPMWIVLVPALWPFCYGSVMCVAERRWSSLPPLARLLRCSCWASTDFIGGLRAFATRGAVVPVSCRDTRLEFELQAGR